MGKFELSALVTEKTELIKLKYTSNKFSCFSYSRRDLVILLMVYNTTYFLLVSLVRHDLVGCMLTAFTFFLIALFIVTLVDVYKKLDEEVLKLQGEHENLRIRLRQELQRVHRLRKKAELENKLVHSNENDKTNIIPGVDDPHFAGTSAQDRTKIIQFDYLNRIISRAKNINLGKEEPQG